MDALAAIGLLSGIAGLIDFSVKVLKGTREVLDKGQLAANIDREKAVETIAILRNATPTATTAPLTQQDDNLRMLSGECQDLGQDLLLLLDKVKSKDGNSTSKKGIATKFNAAWTTGKYRVRYKDDIENLEKRFEQKWALVQAHIVRLSREETKEQLRSLVTSSHEAVQRIEGLRKGVILAPEVETRIGGLLTLGDDVLDGIANDRILEGLAFDGMHGRYEKVHRPYGDTLEWAFDYDVSPDAKRLIDWLRKKGEPGREIFHISGKLGSGKSTLMKKLSDDKRTGTELLAWTGGQRPIIANFFFWAPGSAMQKSLAGLQRALLHDVLEQCPELTKVVLPIIWKRVRGRPWQAKMHVKITAEEVKEAFDRLVSSPLTQSNTGNHLCFFIDGLDEFQPTSACDFTDMVNYLKQWASWCPDNVKICVSSREEPIVLMDAFPAETRLRLHLLTRPDITKYVTERLAPVLSSLPKKQQQTRLINAIVEKAQGVFLWVTLVVSSVRDQVGERARRYTDLMAELEDLKGDMVDLLDRIVDAVGKSSGHNLQRLYQTVVLVDLTDTDIGTHLDGFELDAFAYSFLPDYNDNPAFAHDIPFPELPLSSYDSHDSKVEQEHLQIARAELRRCCRGLFEIGSNSIHLINQVYYAHRSIKDYFARPLVREQVLHETQDFDPVDAVSQIFLATLKLGPGQAMYGYFRRDWTCNVLSTRLEAPNSLDASPPFTFVRAMENFATETQILVADGATLPTAIPSAAWDYGVGIMLPYESFEGPITRDDNPQPAIQLLGPCLPAAWYARDAETRFSHAPASNSPLVVHIMLGRYNYPTWKLHLGDFNRSDCTRSDCNMGTAGNTMRFASNEAHSQLERIQLAAPDMRTLALLVFTDILAGSGMLVAGSPRTNGPLLLHHLLKTGRLLANEPLPDAQLLLGQWYALPIDREVEPAFTVTLWQAFLLRLAGSNTCGPRHWAPDLVPKETARILRVFLDPESNHGSHLDMRLRMISRGPPYYICEPGEKPKGHKPLAQDVNVRLGDGRGGDGGLELVILPREGTWDYNPSESLLQRWKKSLTARDIIAKALWTEPTKYGLAVSEQERNEILEMIDAQIEG